MTTMKKLLILCLLCLGPLLVRAQVPVVDGLSNKQLLNELAKWVQDYAKQHGQQINLEKIFGENKNTTTQITALLQLKQEIEKGLYSVKDFQKLRISDLSRILKELYGVGSPADYGRDLPFMEEYGAYLGRPASVGNADGLYNYLLGGTGAYRPEESGTLDGYLKRTKEQRAKAYSIHVAAQKRKMAAAMTYKRLAEQFVGLAEDLAAQVNADGEHRLSTGERIKAQKMANDYMIKSVQMKQKADQLLQEATQKSSVVQQVDQSRQYFLNRKALEQIQIDE
jgi:hypothetical protein